MSGIGTYAIALVDKSKRKEYYIDMTEKKMSSIERKEFIRDMRAKRYTYREIGDMLGITKQRVWQLDGTPPSDVLKV